MVTTFPICEDRKKIIRLNTPAKMSKAVVINQLIHQTKLHLFNVNIFKLNYSHFGKYHSYTITDVVKQFTASCKKKYGSIFLF